jgi:hypothetical protein
MWSELREMLYRLTEREPETLVACFVLLALLAAALIYAVY